MRNDRPTLSPMEALAKALRDADMCGVIVKTRKGIEFGEYPAIAEEMLGVLERNGYALVPKSDVVEIL